MTVYDKHFFVHDKQEAVFKDDAPGISVDEGETKIDWDEVETVRIDDVPWADAFETTEFYKLPATVARPIPQEYKFGEDTLTLMKPRQELKQAAWSLHNKPWTMDHPNTRMVRNVDDVNGFWRDPRYIDSMDNLDADLYIPTDDSTAQEFIEENTDVSVGFYNRITRTDSYEGAVGGSDDVEDVDGFQTQMYFDHVASVGRGRCSGEQGCGLQDSADDTLVVVEDDEEEEDYDGGSKAEYDPEPFVDYHIDAGGNVSFEKKDGSFISGTLITHDYRDEDGNYFAVSPDENPDGTPKFPISSCSGDESVNSAWKLRNHGDISISVDTLEERIKRRASDLGCDSVPWDTDGENTDSEIDMTEETNDCGGLGLSDLSVDAVAAKHEGVQDELATKDEKIEELEEELESAQDAEERIEELEAQLDEYEAEQKQELVDQITELTDRFDEEDLMEEDLDELEEKLDLVTDLASTESTANSEVDEEETPTVERPRRAVPEAWEN